MKCLRKLNAYPSKHEIKEINTIGSGLLKCCQAIEGIRSNKTIVTHGKTDEDYVVEDSSYAYFIVNAVTTIGLFLLKRYQKVFPINQSDIETDMPF